MWYIIGVSIRFSLKLFIRNCFLYSYHRCLRDDLKSASLSYIKKIVGFYFKIIEFVIISILFFELIEFTTI